MTTTAVEIPIGTPVRYWTGGREGAGELSRTRSAPYLHNGRVPVVFVVGHGAFIALTHVEPVDARSCEISVSCTGCKGAVSGDYLVTGDMDQAARLAIARRRLAAERWSCTEAGDLCPACTPAGEMRAAATTLRLRAKRAAGGPWTCSTVWSPDSPGTSGVYSRAYPTGTIESEVVASARAKKGYGGIRNPHNALWITLMQPAIAAPFAAILEAAADDYDATGRIDPHAIEATRMINEISADL